MTKQNAKQLISMMFGFKTKNIIPLELSTYRTESGCEIIDYAMFEVNGIQYQTRDDMSNLTIYKR